MSVCVSQHNLCTHKNCWSWKSAAQRRKPAAKIGHKNWPPKSAAKKLERHTHTLKDTHTKAVTRIHTSTHTHVYETTALFIWNSEIGYLCLSQRMNAPMNGYCTDAAPVTKPNWTSDGSSLDSYPKLSYSNAIDCAWKTRESIRDGSRLNSYLTHHTWLELNRLVSRLPQVWPFWV